MKKLFALALSAALCLGLCACGGNTGGSTSPETDGTGESGDDASLQKITLCLDWTPNTNHTGIYVAQALGYYEENGLDVEIVQPPEDGATALCAAGQCEFAITVQDSLASAFARTDLLPVTAVAALLQHNTSGIMAVAGEGMDHPAGLEGHNYATWNSPIELAMMDYVIAQDGGDFDNVELIPNNITDEAGAIEARQADSIWVYYGWGCINAELRGVPFDFFYFKDYAPELDYYTPVIIANNDFLAENPDAAKALLEATRRGYEYAIENPEEAAQMLIDGDTTGSLKNSQDLVVASQKWMCDQYKAEVEQWGYIDPARWDGFYQWLSDNGLCEMPIEAGTGFSNDYLA